MAKAKGKEKPAPSTVPADVEEATGDDVTAEPTPSEPVMMEETTEVTVDAGSDKSDDAEKPEEAEESEEEEVKEDGTVEAAMITVTPGGEKPEEGDKKEEAKGDEKVENASNKAKRIRKRKKAAAGAAAAASNDANKPETSAPEKGLKKADGMGLIFMCNAKTKKDCYRYKVLGLPESKKEMVEKVYKGMRLFLFDVDLKLMYGIYKAASPGGYNIEPKAFKSAFPSQVRFTVLNDCQPLPEEKFKAAIKANYFGKNKFNAQLSAEQVKNLCKLFLSGNKDPKQKHVSKAPISVGREQNRRPPRGIVQRNDPYYPRGPTYRREAYASPLPRPVALPPPLPPPYAYERPVDDYYYRREPRDRFMDVEMRPRDPIEYRDPYSLYREPAPYREAVYPASGPSAAYAPPPPLYRY